LSNVILAAFLLSKAMSELGGVFFHFGELKQLILSYCPHLLYVPFPFRYLYVPVLFLYILSMTKKPFHLKKRYLFHFVLFVFFCVLVLLKFQFLSGDTIREMIGIGSFFSSSERNLFNLLEYLQFFGYAVASLIVLRQYRIKLKNVYSSVEHINLSWLNFVLFGFIVWKSLVIIQLVLWNVTGNDYVFVLYITAEVVFLIFVALMVLRGLKQPQIFSGITENQSKQKYEKTPLSDAVKEDYKNKLLRYMKTQRPYLDPSLSLQNLAERASIPPHHLSQILNSCLNQNFFDFINSCRIKESKRLLSEHVSNKKTILEILYDTGFNSKSVFNSAFKRHTGMTPTQFKNLQNS
jgi:AraC-like DNA-binding protein